jgi:hypothetical protein
MRDLGAYNAFESAGRLDQLVMGSWHCYSAAVPQTIKDHSDIFIGSMDLPGDQYAMTAMGFIDKLVAGEEVESGVYRTGWQWLDSTNIDDYYQF